MVCECTKTVCDGVCRCACTRCTDPLLNPGVTMPLQTPLNAFLQDLITSQYPDLNARLPAETIVSRAIGAGFLECTKEHVYSAKSQLKKKAGVNAAAPSRPARRPSAAAESEAPADQPGASSEGLIEALDTLRELMDAHGVTSITVRDLVVYIAAGEEE